MTSGQDPGYRRRFAGWLARRAGAALRGLAIGIAATVIGYVAALIAWFASSSVSCGGGDNVCLPDTPRVVLFDVVVCVVVALVGPLAAFVSGTPLWWLYAVPSGWVVVLVRVPSFSYRVRNHWPFDDGLSCLLIFLAAYCVIAVLTSGRRVGGSRGDRPPPRRVRPVETKGLEP